MTANGGHRKFVEVAMPALAALVVCVLSVGCGQSPTSISSIASATTTLSTAGQSSNSSGTTAQSDDLDRFFAELAATYQPVTIFAPTVLPDDAALADGWFPVLESQDPGSYDGPPAMNPQVLGSGADSEIQVIFRAGDGWLAILENFRGDLGDVTGMPVGTVGGNPAAVYEVNGGELVQWSQDGRWYGVFGRQMARDRIVDVALGMQPVSAESR
jgi:hypothetical protein